HRAAAKVGLGVRDARGVDADRGHRRDRGVPRLGPDALGAKGGHLARGVRTLQSGQVDAADGEIERPELGSLFDRALRERRRSLFSPHLVHAAHAAHERAEVRKGKGSGHLPNSRTAQALSCSTPASPRASRPRSSAKYHAAATTSTITTITSAPQKSLGIIKAASAITVQARAAYITGFAHTPRSNASGSLSMRCRRVT